MSQDVPINSLYRLPNDLILQLSDFLVERDINAAARASSRLFSVLDHALYVCNAKESCSAALAWAAAHEQPATARKALAARANTEALVPDNRNFHEIPRAWHRLPSSTWGLTPLTIAAGRGHLEIVSLLVEAGAAVDVVHKGFSQSPANTPLLAAVEGGHLEVTKFLVGTGAVDVNNVFTESGHSLLARAAIYGHLDIMRYLLPLIDNADASRGGGVSALMCAVNRGQLAAAKLLADSGRVDPNLQAASGFAAGYTAFAFAAYAGNPSGTDEEMAQLLLNTPGLDPDLGDIPPILLAAKSKRDHIVKLMMESNKVKIPVDELFRAACANSLTGVAQLLLRMDDVTKEGDLGRYWLHTAAEAGCTDIVKLLLKKSKAMVDEQRHDGKTALMCAIEGKHRATSTALLKAGADINAVSSGSFTALHFATKGINFNLTQSLLSMGSNVKARTAQGETPLHFACEVGNTRIVQLLLDNGADATEASEDSKTPLHVACKMRWEQVVQLLLSKTPYAHSSLCQGYTPLHAACAAGHTTIVKHLLEHGADAVGSLSDESTPLFLACKGHPIIVRMLLERGADPNQMDSSGSSPLHKACLRNSPKVVSVLLKHGADPNVRDMADATPLHAACSRPSILVARPLIQHGADVNAVQRDGTTPLFLTCRTGGHREDMAQVDFFKLLLAHGANVHVRDNSGVSVLDHACSRRNTKAALLLIDHGADPWARNEVATGLSFSTPFHTACAIWQDDSAMESIIQRLAKPLPDTFPSGWTPLHAAAANGNLAAVKALLRHGLGPMALTKDGRTALQEMLRSEPRVPPTRALPIVTALVEGGVDVNHRDNSGVTALGETMALDEAIQKKLLECTAVR